MDGCGNKDWDNNNDKDQENGEALRDGTLDHGYIMVNSDQLNRGGIFHGSSFHGEVLIDVNRFDYYQVDNEDLLDTDQALRDGPLVHESQTRGNLANHGDGKSNRS